MNPAMKDALQRLYEARFRALEAEAEVLDADDEGALAAELEAAVAEAAKGPAHDRAFQLQVISSLLPKVGHRRAVATLLRILNDSDPSVRARAIADCAAVAETRYPELVAEVERALDGGLTGPALLALPGLLVGTLPMTGGTDDAPPVEVLIRLLDGDDPDVVAEAACGLAELELPGVDDLLSSFADDERRLSDAADGPATIGELVSQLLSMSALERGLND